MTDERWPNRADVDDVLARAETVAHQLDRIISLLENNGMGVTADMFHDALDKVEAATAKVRE